MTDRQSLRQSMLQDSQILANRRRFGLFSQPLSTALGDDSPFRSKDHPRNQMGKPITQPRNIYVSPSKQGRLSKSYFAPLNSLASHSIHDTFIEQDLRLLKEQTSAFNEGRRESTFVPPGKVKPIVNSPYPYKDEINPELDPRRFKMPDNRVRVGPRNFYTNPDHRIIDTHFRPYQYIPDPYERAHELQLQHLKRQKSKEREQPFKPNSFSPKALAKDSVVYASDMALPKKSMVESLPSITKHQSAWRPSSNAKQGLSGLFLPVHRYIESPPVQRKPVELGESQKQAFKGMGANVLSSPSPSVALNRVNMMPRLNRSVSPKH